MSHLANVPEDPVVIVIEEKEQTLGLDQWLMLLETDEPTDVDANAAEIIREIREYGDR